MHPSDTALADHLRRLDGETLVALVADLWAARGYETTREGDTVVATHGTETVRIGVPQAARTGGASAADVVVAPDGRATAEARVVDAATLAEMLCYAVDRPVARDICERHLGASPETLPAPLTSRARRRAARVVDVAKSERVVDAATPVLAVVAVVFLGAVLVGAVPVVGDPGAADSDEASVVTPATPTAAAGADADGDVPADAERLQPDIDPGPFPSNATTPPPGVSEDGITDLDALAAAHERALANRSHTVWMDRSTRRLNGQGQVLAHDIDMVTDGRRYLVTTADVGSGTRRHLETVYYDGIAAYRADYNETTNEYTQVRQADLRSVAPTPESVRESLVWRYLSADETTVTGTTRRGDSVVYRVVGTGKFDPKGFDHIWNYTVVAEIDARGFVRDLTVRFDARTAGRIYRVRVETTYDRVGSTTLEQPAWYERHLANATAE